MNEESQISEELGIHPAPTQVVKWIPGSGVPE
jgi:hypothetical protein